MYKNFYNFVESPFNITADPDFFFLSTQHSEAFSHLIYGIKRRKGIIVISGEIGTGKTTLCRTLLSRLQNDKHVKTALILNPTFSAVQLLQLILNDLGVPTTAKNKYALTDTLNKYLLEQSSLGNNVVLIIDECQNLGVNQLEQIRLLSNLETEKEKLLQIVLVGQPELLDKLKLDSLRQLNQRVAVRFHILSLDRKELESYINHRIQVASSKSAQNKIKFTQEALDLIYDVSKGTPRMINILCDRALLAGYTNETHSIDGPILQQCIKEVVHQ